MRSKDCLGERTGFGEEKACDTEAGSSHRAPASLVDDDAAFERVEGFFIVDRDESKNVERQSQAGLAEQKEYEAQEDATTFRCTSHDLDVDVVGNERPDFLTDRRTPDAVRADDGRAFDFSMDARVSRQQFASLLRLKTPSVIDNCDELA